MPTQKDIRKQYEQVCETATQVVEEQARKILREHPNLDEFVMGMGSWFFTDKEGNNLDETDRAYLKPFAEIFYEWDEYLKISGEPMRFTASGKKVTNW